MLVIKTDHELIISERKNAVVRLPLRNLYGESAAFYSSANSIFKARIAIPPFPHLLAAFLHAAGDAPVQSLQKFFRGP